MNGRRRAAVILAVALWLAACQSSPPTHYFALASEVAATAARPSLPGAPLRVERITVPGTLDRLEIVRRGDANQLRIATFDLWASPLDTMIQRVISEDLASRLAPGAVVSISEPAARERQRHLYLDIQEFSGDGHGAVQLRAAWLLQTPGGGADLRGIEELTAAASDTSADALAAAMSRALGELANRLATALVAHAGDPKSE